MLHLIEYTFLNKDTEQPFADFLVEVYAASSSAPLRVYRDAAGKQLLSAIGQVITNNEGTIHVYARAHAQYELVLSSRNNRVILDKVSVIGISATEGSSPTQLSESETTSVRALLVGGTPGSGTVTSVNASGGTTGLTFSGGPITGSGTLTLNGGILTVPNGGTGEDNVEDAFNAFAPSTTKGDLIVFDGTTHVRLEAGVDGQILTADSAADAGLSFQDAPDSGSGTLPDGDYGDITASGSGTTLTIDADVVTNTKLANMADSTIKGRALGAGSGDPTDLSASQVRTLINVANGATANSSDATLLARANHTGTQTAATISDFSEAVDDRVAALAIQGTNVTLVYDDSAGTLTINAANTNLTSTPGASNVVIMSDTGNDATILAATGSVAGAMSAADKTKLDGIATGATANSSDATLLARANHTGTQVASTISDFSEAVDDRLNLLLVEGTGIDLTYNDGANTLTIATTGIFVTDGDKGDIVIGSSGTTYSIDSGVITTAARTVLDDVTTGDMLTTLGGQPLDATLTALAGVTVAANKGLFATGADAFSTYDLTAGGRALGGVAGTSDTFPYFSASNTVTLASVTAAGLAILDDANAAAQRTTLGLAINTDVQAHSTALDQVAGLGDPNADRIVFWDDSASSYAYLTPGTNLSITGTTLNASGGGSLSDGDYGDIVVSSSGTVFSFDSGVVTTFAKTFLDDVDASAVRTTLGLGTIAILADTILGQVDINVQTGSYTLVLTDAGKQVDMNVVTTANNLTIPPNSSVAFPVNTVIFVSQINTGVTTIVAGGGVTILKPASKTLALLEQYEVVTLHKKATDTWQVGGGLGIA